MSLPLPSDRALKDGDTPILPSTPSTHHVSQMQPTLYRLCPALSPTQPETTWSTPHQLSRHSGCPSLGWASQSRSHPGTEGNTPRRSCGLKLNPPFGAAMQTQRKPAYREKKRDRCTGRGRENETTVQRGKLEEGLPASFPCPGGARPPAIVCCTSSLSLLLTPLSLNLIEGSSCPLQQNYPRHMVRALPTSGSRAGLLIKPCPLLSL